jgi:adenine/guanine phosphoribosyltransferase-like PRPP-binding protein
MPFEQLSDTIKRSIERGTDTIATAARRGALVGAIVGSTSGVGLVAIGIVIGRVFA